jgi:hypothetical protein
VAWMAHGNDASGFGSSLRQNHSIRVHRRRRAQSVNLPVNIAQPNGWAGYCVVSGTVQRVDFWKPSNTLLRPGTLETILYASSAFRWPDSVLWKTLQTSETRVLLGQVLPTFCFAFLQLSHLYLLSFRRLDGSGFFVNVQ